MLASKKLLAVLVMSLAALPFAGCASEIGEEEEDDEAEEEPVAETNDELRSAVSCKQTVQTAYTKGRAHSIPVIKVGGKPVSRATGHAFLKMQAAAQAAGVRLSLTSGFRTMEEQRRLYNCYQTKRCNNGNLAARPGYSNHQNGIAVDLSTSTWLARNAGRFGFVRTVSKEPWHYEFRGRDPGGPCARSGSGAPEEPAGDADVDTSEDERPTTQDGITWVAPAQDASVRNGFSVRSRARISSIVKVAYSQGTLTFGTSTAKNDDFSLDYSFNYLGDKTLTAKGYDASGKLVAVDHVDFTLLP